jgi:hypothetical protein
MRPSPTIVMVLTLLFGAAAALMHLPEPASEQLTPSLCGFLAVILLAPPLLLLFAWGALRYLDRPTRWTVLLIFSFASFLTLQTMIDFLRLIQSLE